MKILYVVPFANIRVKQFAAHLEQLGNQVLILDVSHCWVAETALSEGKYFAGQQQNNNIRYIYPPTKIKNITIQVIVSIPRITMFIRKYIREQKIDAVIAYNPAVFTALPVWLACLTKKVPWYIYYIELVAYAPTGMAFRRWLEKWLVKKADYIISLTECWKEYLVGEWNIPRDRILIMRLAIDIKRYNQNVIHSDKYRNIYNLSPEDRVIVNAGTTYPVKTKTGWFDLQDVATLIRAIPIILKTYPQLKLILLGLDNDDAIKNLVKDLHLEEYVVIQGRFMFWEEQHLSTLALADVLCIPSSDVIAMRYFSKYKALDYMMAKRPIIAAGTPSLKETFKEGALFYTPYDHQSLANLVIYSFQHPIEMKENIEKAYQIVKTEHLWEQESKRLNDFLHTYIRN